MQGEGAQESQLGNHFCLAFIGARGLAAQDKTIHKNEANICAGVSRMFGLPWPWQVFPNVWAALVFEFALAATAECACFLECALQLGRLALKSTCAHLSGAGAHEARERERTRGQREEHESERAREARERESVSRESARGERARESVKGAA